MIAVGDLVRITADLGFDDVPVGTVAPVRKVNGIGTDGVYVSLDSPALYVALCPEDYEIVDTSDEDYEEAQIRAREAL